MNLPLSARLTRAAASRDVSQVMLGVRPEDIRVAATDDGGLPARVHIVEPMGSLNVVFASVGPNRLAAVTPPDFFRKTGDPVWLTLDAEKSHLFDASSESRLRPD
jgi:multiple sugar transport system ATP-binding protein